MMKRLLIRALLAGALLAGTSCLKKTDLNDDNLGPAVAPEAVADALGAGFGTINYGDIKAGEQTKTVLSQTLQDGVPQNLLEQEITISQVVSNDASTLALDLHVETKDLIDSSNDVTKDISKTFTKYSGYAFADDDTDDTLFLFQTLQNVALASCINSGSYPETCHNLVSTDVSIKVPETLALTQHATTCPVANNCYIAGKKVEFDLVQLYQMDDDGKPRRIHYTFLLSQEVPFTSKVLKYCTRALYEMDGATQKVLADLCYSVQSYTFGH